MRNLEVHEHTCMAAGTKHMSMQGSGCMRHSGSPDAAISPAGNFFLQGGGEGMPGYLAWSMARGIEKGMSSHKTGGC